MESNQDHSELDKKMEEVGMIPFTEMLKKLPLDEFIANTSVTDSESFEYWLSMRYEEMLKLQIKLELENRQDDELYEWSVAHTAVLREVIINYRNSKG